MLSNPFTHVEVCLPILIGEHQRLLHKYRHQIEFVQVPAVQLCLGLWCVFLIVLLLQELCDACKCWRNVTYHSAVGTIDMGGGVGLVNIVGGFGRCTEWYNPEGAFKNFIIY
jgi:hypothetical protein